MDWTAGRGGAAGMPSQGNVFHRHPEPLPLHGDVLDLTTQSSPASQPAAAEPSQVAPATTAEPVATPSPAAAAVKEEPAKRPTAVKVFWWSTAIGLISFLLFGLCLETFDPDGESFLTTILALGFFLGLVTAVCARIYLIVRRFTGR